jgi:hypothetical protein
MLTDPITVTESALVFTAGGPFSGTTEVLDGLVLNKLEQSGRESIYEAPGSVLTALNLALLRLNVAHQTTNQGRVRSKFRVDAKMLDDLQKEHSCSVTLTVDRAAVPTAEGIIAWSRAIELFFKLAVNGTQDPAEEQTTDVFAQFLNGES